MRHLKSFYVFHTAASSKSYSEAAERLSITHGAVSKQVKQLEGFLGQSLFYKEGRHVFLTLEGELLKQYTHKAFSALSDGVQALSQLEKTHLDVSCEPSLTMRWLMPRLAEFNAENEADIRLSTAGGPVNLGLNGLSMAIRRDDFEIPHHYQVTPLVKEWVGPVCSKTYWDSIQNDLSKACLLHSNTRTQAWSDWLEMGFSQDSIPDDRLAALHLALKNNSHNYAHFYFVLQAAQDDLGFAIGSYPVVQDDLKKGRLIAPFGFIESGHQYVLLNRSDEKKPLAYVFQAWLLAQMKTARPYDSLAI